MASSAWSFISAPLWSVKEFTIATDNGWGRSHLKRIDQQLARAKNAEGDPSKYIPALRSLIDECREWMISKEKKFARKAKTSSYEKRLKAVTTLMEQALFHLKCFTFEQQKQNGAHSQAVALKPGYDRERNEFLDMKSANPWNHGLRLDPHSGSFVTAGMRDIVIGNADMRNRHWDGKIEPLIGKSVSDMSDDEFYFMSKQLKQHWGVELGVGGFLQRVHYVRKLERISNYMLVPIAGLLYKDTGHHTYSSCGPDGKDLYAMDKYGNLMTVPGDKTFSDNGSFQSEHRHSSLNAGNAVICAGYISIENGVVKYIDNKSGHYKPTKKDLARAVVTLMNQHSLDLDGTNVVGYTANGPNSMYAEVNVVGGSQYISKVIPPPPIPPAY